jgi:hypothetical protein
VELNEVCSIKMIVDGELGEMLQEAGMIHFQPYFQK